MKRVLVSILVAFALLGANCGSAPPRAPIGLDKRPANAPGALAGIFPAADRSAPIARSVPALAPTAAAMLPLSSTTSAPERLDALPSRPRLATFVLSDLSAPRGIDSLTPQDRADLLVAARSAVSIRLLCRGDGARPSATVRAKLILRGVKVKRFLVAQGIDASKIRIFVRSAGGFVADNASYSGRAQNRRVEILFSQV